MDTQEAKNLWEIKKKYILFDDIERGYIIFQ